MKKQGFAVTSRQSFLVIVMCFAFVCVAPSTSLVAQAKESQDQLTTTNTESTGATDETNVNKGKTGESRNNAARKKKSDSQRGWFVHLLAIIIGGALGGVAYGIGDKKGRTIHLPFIKSPDIDFGALADAFIGTVTALGLVYYFGAVFGADSRAMVKDPDLVWRAFGLAIISGFAGRPLLAAMARSIRARMEKLEGKVEEIDEISDQLINENHILAGWQAFHDNEYESAKRQFQLVLSAQSTNERALYGKAMATGYLGESNPPLLIEAASLIEQAIAVNSTPVEYHYNLACMKNAHRDRVQGSAYTVDEILKHLEDVRDRDVLWAEAAWDDPDLKSLHRHSRFKAITSRT